MRNCSHEPTPGYKTCEDCRTKRREDTYRWRAQNGDAWQAYVKNRNRKRRKMVLDYYGGVCACCGEDTFEFLALDHKDGGGEAHRAEVGQGSLMIDWAISNDFPDLFQVLCHNCNSTLGYYGYCPHSRDE